MAGSSPRHARLRSYSAKRNFRQTPEPSHRTRAARTKRLRFVVQKHAATRLHWDFRLEWRGTLRSWAVPKGPSLDPADKRLAVEVEDHPLEYARFEGDIPAGQYGAGHVDIWDKGWWKPIENAARGFEKGHLEFEMSGAKLRGRWHLVRTRLQGRKQQWLLMKGRDGFARAASTPPLPKTVKPQLATLVDKMPGDDGWVYELKYDGIRLLARCDGRDVRVLSRNGIDWTRKAEPVVKALAALNLEAAWLDGELIATDAQGRSDFSLLQHHLEQRRGAELQYCLFDLLFHRGEDLRGLPLRERKARLDAVLAQLPPQGPLRLADQIQSNSTTLMTRVCALRLEGLIAKRSDSRYRGSRSADWLKIKCQREQEFVVGGVCFLPRRGTGTFSSLLVGVRAGRKLKYAGRVGGGFDAAERATWRRSADELAQAACPFDGLPEKRPGEIFQWMKPERVIQVAFAGWTRSGILRQPRYLGLREDRDPRSVIRETPASTEQIVSKTRKSAKVAREQDSGPLGMRLTHPDRILFPRDGITKLELAEYFAAIGEAALPHYRNRPLSILRNTHGTQPFFQKHFLEQSSAGLRVVRIPNADKDPEFVVCNSVEGLLHLVQLGAVELHSWGASMPRPTKADRLTFDLDPGAGLPYPPLRDAALAIRKLLQDLGLESWVKTTGGKGLHVVVPLTRPLPDWDTAKEFARGVTRYMERLAPTLFTSKSGERNRKRKIFVDYLRNAFGATAVAAFSPRWRPGVGVSTPVSWEEIDEDLRGAHFNLLELPRRFSRQRRDPWKTYWSTNQALTKTALRRLTDH